MKTSVYVIFVVIFWLVFISSCSTVRQIRPLERGESALTISLGGPITKLGDVYIPLPLLSAGYNRGILSNKLDIEAGLHLTEALYKTLMIDAGVNYRPILSNRWKPGLIITPKIFFMTNFKNARLYPSLCITSNWKINSHVYIYTGLENWFEFSKTRDDNNKQKHHWLINPYLGTNFGRDKLFFQIEGRWYIPNKSNQESTTSHIGVGEHGILGVMLGINYIFKGRN